MWLQVQVTLDSLSLSTRMVPCRSIHQGFARRSNIDGQAIYVSPQMTHILRCCNQQMFLPDADLPEPGESSVLDMKNDEKLTRDVD